MEDTRAYPPILALFPGDWGSCCRRLGNLWGPLFLVNVLPGAAGLVSERPPAQKGQPLRAVRPIVSTFFNIFQVFSSVSTFLQDSCRVKTEQTRQHYQRGPTPVMQLPESSHPGNRTSRLHLDARAVLYALVWSAAFQIVPRTRITGSRGPTPTCEDLLFVPCL